MGFFDSMKKSYDKETKALEERRRRSKYRTVVQLDADHYNELKEMNDGALLSKYNNSLVSDDDKEIISKILDKRGYKYDEERGGFGKK